MAFNEDGELFTFDSDMEWDIGLPWYRPIRINHVTSGSDYGYRENNEKWSPAYPDNLPAVINVGQGSPTNVMSGKMHASLKNIAGAYSHSIGAMGLFIILI